MNLLSKALIPPCGDFAVHLGQEFLSDLSRPFFLFQDFYPNIKNHQQHGCDGQGSGVAQLSGKNMFLPGHDQQGCQEQVKAGVVFLEENLPVIEAVARMGIVFKTGKPTVYMVAVAGIGLAITFPQERFFGQHDDCLLYTSPSPRD